MRLCLVLRYALLLIEEVTIAANERYDLLQEEEIQRTATAVADFNQPTHATAEQPTLTEEECGWLFTHVINLLSIDRPTNPRRHAYAVPVIIRETEESQTGIPDEIAMAIIAQANTRYDARQATVPATATPTQPAPSPMQHQHKPQACSMWICTHCFKYIMRSSACNKR
jgi:hypothetical protein